MSNLIDYLMGFKTPKSKKGKKTIRKRRVRWGSRMGKVQNANNKQKDNKIEKLLDILVARSAPTNTIELARLKEIESDFQLAQNLQQQEYSKSKVKKIDESKEELTPLRQSPAKSRQSLDRQSLSTPISSLTNENKTLRIQAYQQQYDNIEEGYTELIQSLNQNIGENSIIGRDAFTDFVAHREQLNADRNVLRKELLDDVKNNPQDIGDWKAYIEISENETAQLLELDNKASSIIYDQAMRGLTEREALTEDQKKQAEIIVEKTQQQLEQNKIALQKEQELNQELENLTTKLKKEGTEKEAVIQELDKTQKNFSETIMKPFNKGKETVEQFLAGNVSGGSNQFQRALGTTNLADTWDNYGKSGTEEKKRQIKLALAKRIEEQQQFLPKQVEGFLGALPAGSISVTSETISEGDV
jgi:hypothetical protein